MRNGFSLLEIMIALVILAILSALSIPLYTQHLTHEKRLVAEINLVKLANALEKYHIVNDTYAGASLQQLGFLENSADNSYQFVIAAANGSEFLLQAVPKKADSCGTLELDATGRKSATGSTDAMACWF